MSSRQHLPWIRAGVLAGSVAVSACSAQATPDTAAPAANTTTVATMPPASSRPPTAASFFAVTASSQAAPTPVLSRPGDVTQHPAASLVPSRPTGRSSPASAAGVDYADPLGVAVRYVTRRLTYRYDDLAGYRAALTAPAFTTPTFAARSEPNGAALARVQTAQETSGVRVGAAEVEGEAPNTATTQFVSVACTTTTTYRGGGGTALATWTLRLVQAPPGQWRVDGVLSTG